MVCSGALSSKHRGRSSIPVLSLLREGGLLSLSTLPRERSLNSCWSSIPMALSCFIMTPCDSISNGDSRRTLRGTTVFIEVGFQLFSARAISVVKYFHDHQGPSIVRCVTSHLLPVTVKVLKCKIIRFSLEISALSKLLLCHYHVHSHFLKYGSKRRVRGNSST